MKILLPFFIFPIIAFGQITYSGFIINKKTKAKIPYATIGLVKENIGINAGEDGHFILTAVNPAPVDTLIISSVGFEIFNLPVAPVQSGNIYIELTELEINLPEVVVTNRESNESSTLNDFSNCGNHFAGSNGFQTQLAQHFKAPEINSKLTEIKICRMAGVFDPEKTIFRIRIYDMDEITKAPSADLCNEIIEVKTSSKIIRLNVTKHKINIPGKDFFVAIEWLKIPANEHKSVIKRAGEEVEYRGYRPSIGWTENYNSTMEAWSLDNRKVWKPMSNIYNKKTSVAIAATIKY